MRSCLLVLAFSTICFSQTQTPQQIITALVTQQADLTAKTIAVLNQVPELTATIDRQQKQIAELQSEIENMKKEKIKK